MDDEDHDFLEKYNATASAQTLSEDDFEVFGGQWEWHEAIMILIDLFYFLSFLAMKHDRYSSRSSFWIF